MLISVFGVPGLTHAIGWGWGFGIIAISLGYFIVLDFVKVFMFRYWSFEVTALLWPSPARRRGLAERKARKEVLARVAINNEKVRTAVRAIGAISLLKNAVSEKQARV
ncbi:hypothetical protein K7432_004653 [Basidiobolus ranarum]|uniref:Uncharacterized protein n=1 Tax=Basidiobolus ranarum TaxID=34480 RepID=A0ABR2WXZ9_9FUNG